MPDDGSGSIGDLFTQYGAWVVVVPAVALAWGLLTAKDKGVRKYKRRKSRSAKIQRLKDELKAAKA